MSVCPFARGFTLHELDCALARDADARLPWWCRLLHMLRGDYWCENLGVLPCARHENHFHKAKEDR